MSVLAKKMLLHKCFELIIKLFGKNTEAPYPFGGWRERGRTLIKNVLGCFLSIKGVSYTSNDYCQLLRKEIFIFIQPFRVNLSAKKTVSKVLNDVNNFTIFLEMPLQSLHLFFGQSTVAYQCVTSLKDLIWFLNFAQIFDQFNFFYL